mmetsp:Transcript_99445/g.310484  ORF Transcript_99445/g.310484 Transcript_99445/m.310484 type:complete len:551 (-) Transcript_99445:35-1687(-)
MEAARVGGALPSAEPEEQRLLQRAKLPWWQQLSWARPQASRPTSLPCSPRRPNRPGSTPTGCTASPRRCLPPACRAALEPQRSPQRQLPSAWPEPASERAEAAALRAVPPDTGTQGSCTLSGLSQGDCECLTSRAPALPAVNQGTGGSAAALAPELLAYLLRHTREGGSDGQLPAIGVHGLEVLSCEEPEPEAWEAPLEGRSADAKAVAFRVSAEPERRRESICQLRAQTPVRRRGKAKARGRSQPCVASRPASTAAKDAGSSAGEAEEEAGAPEGDGAGQSASSRRAEFAEAPKRSSTLASTGAQPASAAAPRSGGPPDAPAAEGGGRGSIASVDSAALVEVKSRRHSSRVPYKDEFQYLVALARKHRMPLREVRERRREFQGFGASGSGGGFLSAEEFMRVVRQHFNLGPADSVPQHLVRGCGAAERGRFGFEDFLLWTTRTAYAEERLVSDPKERTLRQTAREYGFALPDVEKVKAVFDAFDSDKSDSIDEEEFGNVICALMKAGRPSDIGAKKLRRFWTEVDTDGSGAISFLEFLTWYFRFMGGHT